MLNNKGFAVTSVLYTLLIAFLLFLGAALAQFSSSTRILSKANDDLTGNMRLPYEIRIYYSANGGSIDNTNTKYKLNGNSIMPKDGNSDWTVFASSSRLGDWYGDKYETIKFPYHPELNGDLGLKRDGYYFADWTANIQYCYLDGCDKAEQNKKSISKDLTLKSINEYLNENSPAKSDEGNFLGVNYLQVFYTANWLSFEEVKINNKKVGINIYYNIESMDNKPDSDNSEYKKNPNISHNNKYEHKEATDGIFIKYKSIGTVALASSSVSGLPVPSFPIKASNLASDFDLTNKGHTLKGWKATIHSSCDMNNIANRKTISDNDTATADNLIKAAKDLDFTTCSNPAIKIVYNAIWE